jgi:hypothetical protein
MSTFADYRDYGFLTQSALHLHRPFLPAVVALRGNCGPGLRVLERELRQWLYRRATSGPKAAKSSALI